MKKNNRIESPSPLTRCDVEVRTTTNRWVVPFNCTILKTLVAEKRIQASDLRFASQTQCHEFIKRVLLLAAEDECCTSVPSELAGLARELIGLSNRPVQDLDGAAR